MYKLITIDMDGTMLGPDHKVSQKNIEAVKKVREKGVKVVLCSGRPIEGLESFLEIFDMNKEDDYVIGFNGGVIKKVVSGEIIKAESISGKDLKDVFHLSKELNVACHAFTKQGLIADEIETEGLKLETGLNNIVVHKVDFDDIADDEFVYKVMFADTEEKVQQAMAKVPESFKERFTVVRTGPMYYEFLKKGLNKGEAVEYLAKSLGIKQEEVMSIGDAGNDVDMLKYAGLGVAMENAYDETKAVADYITKSNAEDGVAYALEKFILEQGK